MSKTTEQLRQNLATLIAVFPVKKYVSDEPVLPTKIAGMAHTEHWSNMQVFSVFHTTVGQLIV